jgi:hypothetical protein
MCVSRLLRAAIGTLGLVLFTTPVALAAGPADAAAGRAVATQTPSDSPSVLVDVQSCRYKPLSGSRIKVQVCTARDGVEYRMDRRARTIAVTIIGLFASAPVTAPLPQVQ